MSFPKLSPGVLDPGNGPYPQEAYCRKVGRGREKTREGQCSIKGIFKSQGKDLVCGWLIPSPETERERGERVMRMSLPRDFSPLMVLWKEDGDCST